jgi:hypothetical protein
VLDVAAPQLALNAPAEESDRRAGEQEDGGRQQNDENERAVQGIARVERVANERG